MFYVVTNLGLNANCHILKGDRVEVLGLTNQTNKKRKNILRFKTNEQTNKQKLQIKKRSMVEVLGPSCHKRENFPPEIDVYKVPHSRLRNIIATFYDILKQLDKKHCRCKFY